MKYLIIILVYVALLSGCNNDTIERDYPIVIAWNEVLYALSIAEIPIQDIGKELGKIESIRTPMPKKNGESNQTPVGSVLFEINGKNPQDNIAVRVNDKYFDASKLGPLQ